jgi:hypothetical protein
MDWQFTGSEWEAESGEHLWRITVTEHGLFDVGESDSELITETGVFHSLVRAKAFCEQQESKRVSLVFQ